MCKLLLLLFTLIATAHGDPPRAPNINFHQFKVYYHCAGSTENRSVLVDAESKEAARAIIEDMIPCVEIQEITEIL